MRSLMINIAIRETFLMTLYQLLLSVKKITLSLICYLNIESKKKLLLSAYLLYNVNRKRISTKLRLKKI